VKKSTRYEEGKTVHTITEGPVEISSSYDQFIDEVAFMYMYRNIAVLNPVSKFYNFIFFLRWALMTFTSYTWWDQIRLFYSIYFFVNLIMLGITIYVFTLGAFHRVAGFLIILSELLMLFRHLAHLVHFQDQFGSLSLGVSGVVFWVNIAYWTFSFGELFELILLFEPWFHSKKKVMMAPKAESSEQLKGLQSQNENELINRVF